MPQEIVALDAKALVRALDRGESMKSIVTSWAEGSRLVLGQLKVEDKSNEITAMTQLLRLFVLSGCIVTMDAMECQNKIAREMVESDAVGWLSKETRRRCTRKSKCSSMPRPRKRNLPGPVGPT